MISAVFQPRGRSACIADLDDALVRFIARTFICRERCPVWSERGVATFHVCDNMVVLTLSSP
jgi:hypothetical protein